MSACTNPGLNEPAWCVRDKQNCVFQRIPKSGSSQGVLALHCCGMDLGCAPVRLMACDTCNSQGIMEQWFGIIGERAPCTPCSTACCIPGFECVNGTGCKFRLELVVQGMEFVNGSTSVVASGSTAGASTSTSTLIGTSATTGNGLTTAIGPAAVSSTGAPPAAGISKTADDSTATTEPPAAAAQGGGGSSSANPPASAVAGIAAGAAVVTILLLGLVLLLTRRCWIPLVSHAGKDPEGHHPRPGPPAAEHIEDADAKQAEGKFEEEQASAAAHHRDVSELGSPGAELVGSPAIGSTLGGGDFGMSQHGPPVNQPWTGGYHAGGQRWS